MISPENLTKVYEAILCRGGGTVLTTKELNSYGFNSKNLTELVNNGTLDRVKRGFYIFLKIDDLFYYGKTLIANKEYEKAKKCFLKCLEIDATYPGVNFRLFLIEIQNHNYEKAFEYFEQFYDSDNEFYNVDNNVYLYLLSVITPLPEEYKNYARYLKLEDLRISEDDKRFENKSEQNRIRAAICNKKFGLAIKYLNYLCKRKGKTSVQELLIKELLNQALVAQKNFMQDIIDLILQEKYEELLSYYEEMDTRYDIGIVNQYIIFIIKDLLAIIKSKKIPKIEIYSTDKVLNAINERNYELALKLNIEYNKTKNITNENSPLYVALQAINREINKLKEAAKAKSTIPTQAVVPKAKEAPTPTVKVIVPFVEDKIQVTHTENNKSNITNASIADIIKYLMIQDFDNVILSVRLYLDSINKRQYEFLLINLIKLSLLEKDNAFIKPMTTLIYVSRDNYEFNISEYIGEFYMVLSQNKFAEARIYLEILKGAKELGQDCVFTVALEQVLNNTEMQANQNNFSDELLNKVDQAIATIPIELEVKSKITEQPKGKEPVVPPVKVDKTSQSEEPNYDIEYIKSQVEKASVDGVALLKPMKKSQVDYLLDLIDSISDVSAFVIGSDNKYQIVLRIRPKISEYIDVKGIIKEGNDFYNNGDYKSCISVYKLLLKLENVKAFVFAKIGLAYLKIRNKPLAIEYLTIATGLAKIEKSSFDFTDLIARLQGMISQEDRKTFVRMKESDFTKNDNYYNITNITDVLAMFASGSNINEVCEAFNLSDEQRNIVLLILAREYYYQGDLKTGDIYLKMVEKLKKSKYVVSVLNEIRKNRQFYKNRIGNDFRPIMMTL